MDHRRNFMSGWCKSLGNILVPHSFDIFGEARFHLYREGVGVTQVNVFISKYFELHLFTCLKCDFLTNRIVLSVYRSYRDRLLALVPELGPVGCLVLLAQDKFLTWTQAYASSGCATVQSQDQPTKEDELGCVF